MILFPAIDLRAGKVVRLTRGLPGQSTIYDRDPLQTALGWQEQGAAWIHLVDLDAALGEDSTNRPRVREILRGVTIPVQVGGGLRTLADIEEAFDCGASRVIVGSMAVERPDWLQAALQRWGERVAVGLDARGGSVTTQGWTRVESLSVSEFAGALQSAGVRRVIYTETERDGLLEGPATESSVLLARTTNLAVIASGGVGSLEDLRRLRESGAGLLEGVVVGKALYEGRFTLSEARRTLSTP